MKKYKEFEINKMRNYVINALVANFHYDYYKAKSTVVSSAFNRMLVEDADYVFHYTVGYWADQVNNEACAVFIWFLLLKLLLLFKTNQY
jgi:hypothetical protein